MSNKTCDILKHIAQVIVFFSQISHAGISMGLRSRQYLRTTICSASSAGIRGLPYYQNRSTKPYRHPDFNRNQSAGIFIKNPGISGLFTVYGRSRIFPGPGFFVFYGFLKL